MFEEYGGVLFHKLVGINAGTTSATACTYEEEDFMHILVATCHSRVDGCHYGPELGWELAPWMISHILPKPQNILYILPKMLK